MNTLPLAIIQREELDTIQEAAKLCSRCGESKTVADFPRNRTRPDGYEYHCKDCAHDLYRQWKEANRDKWRESKRRNYSNNVERERERARTKRKENPESLDRHNRTYNSSHPNRMDAVNTVNRAVAVGSLPHVSTLFCDQCGKPAQEYHHPSYEPEFWLDVQPLCRSCHRLLHTEMKRQEQEL